MVALLIHSVINENIVSSCIAVAFFVVMPIFVEYTFRKAYKSKKFNGGEIIMHFYEEHVESEGTKGTTKFLYKNLYKVVETKTSFYIMMGNNMGFIVMKENCSEELCEFIRNIKKD
ncbi:MAG: YcxB family protein [Clostridia bacterium]|nr:YcxB family protein [Clostridia bacterium]